MRLIVYVERGGRCENQGEEEFSKHLFLEYLFYNHYAPLYTLAGCCIFKKISIDIAHLPTMMLVIGYPVYWAELYLFKSSHGQTTLLAVGLFVLLSLWVLGQKVKSARFKPTDFYRRLKEIDPASKILWGAGGLISFFILLCACWASLFPVHLIQEFDALNYHITLPRQHLILGSFQHIPWAADDLFLLPLNFALAPFWLVTVLPNKFPQFLFFIGLVLVSVNLVRTFSNHKLISTVLIVFAILGSHHIGIQMGLAMLDLVLCYLFLAALDSLLNGRMILFLIEFSFFFWAKPFIPLQVAVIGIALMILVKILPRLGFSGIKWGGGENIDCRLKERYAGQFKKILAGFCILSMLIGGPFLVKSMYYSGTPLFPFAPGAFMINKDIDETSNHWQSIKASSQGFVKGVKDDYGYGRSPLAFLKHFWLIAVPDEGVNNQYDYPLGLVYLLVLVPFAAIVFHSLRNKEFVLLHFLVVFFWLSWWIGSHQTRFLYIPILLMIIMVVSEVKILSRVFTGAIIFALLFNALSVYRAHRHDFGLSREEVLRGKDLKLITMNKNYIQKKRKDAIELDFHDAAFAQFPVTVTPAKLPHTLAL